MNNDAMPTTRRELLSAAAGLCAAGALAPFVWAVDAPQNTANDGILGQGDFRYRPVPNWAQLKGVPVKNGHGLACDKAGNLLMLTHHVENNLTVIDPKTGEVL